MTILSTTDKGKQFENQVAELYRLMGYFVEQNVGIQGHQVDLIITFTQPGGIVTKTAVECKYVEKGNLAKEAFMGNWYDLSDLKRSEKVQNVVFVTTNGFAKDIWDTAKENKITLLTFCQLQHQILKLDVFIDDTIAHFENDELSKYYVDIIGQDDEKAPRESFVIDNYVSKWIEEEKANHLSILGEYGTGKTSFCKKLAHDMAVRYKSDSFNARIPLLINLREYSKVMSMRQLITDVLVNEYGIQGISYQLFQKMNEDGLFLLIFDGFDEMAQKVIFDIAAANFSMIADLAKPQKSKVLLTCRVEFFRTHEKEREILAAIDERYNFDIVYLKQFNDEQIKSFLKKRVPLIETQNNIKKGWEYYHRKIYEIFDLSDLAKRPVLLDLIVKYLPKIVHENTTINAATLYRTALSEELKRRLQHGATIIERDDRLKLMKLLATWMYNSDKLFIHYEQIPDLLDLKSHFDLKTRRDIEYHLNDFLTCSFLNRDPNGNYRFSHKSLVDFLVAWKFVEDIKGNFEKDFRQKPITYEIIQFMKELEVDKRRLYDWILSTRNQSVENAKYLGGNCVTLLNALGENLGNLKFDYSKTKLDNAKFSGQNLTGILFKGASLKNASLSNTILTNTDFSSADLTGVDFEHMAHVYCLAFSPDGKSLAGASSSMKTKIWNMVDRSEISTLGSHSGSVFSVAFTSNGKYLATGSNDKSVIIWDAKKYTEVRMFREHSGGVKSVAFSPNNKYLVSAGYDGRIIVWDVENLCLLEKLYGHDSGVFCLDFSPDGKYLASGGNDKSVIIWDANRFTDVMKIFPIHSSVKSVAFSPDSKYLAIAGLDYVIAIWNMAKRELMKKLYAGVDSVFCVAFSPDGKYLASAGQNGSIVLWNTEDFSEIAGFTAHHGLVNSLEFSPDGKFLASASQDETIRFWNLDKSAKDFGKLVFSLSAPINCKGMLIEKCALDLDTKSLLLKNGAIEKRPKNAESPW